MKTITLDEVRSSLHDPRLVILEVLPRKYYDHGHLPGARQTTNDQIGAQAKELVRTAQTTAESIATDNDGNYEKVSPAELHVIEPAIVTGIGVPTKDAWLTQAVTEDVLLAPRPTKHQRAGGALPRAFCV